MNNPNSKERARQIAFHQGNAWGSGENLVKLMDMIQEALDATAEEAAGIAESFADKPSVNKSLVIAQAIRAHFNLIKRGSENPTHPKGEDE